VQKEDELMPLKRIQAWELPKAVDWDPDRSQKDRFCERPFRVDPTRHLVWSNVVSGFYDSRVRIYGKSTTNSMTIRDSNVSVLLDNALDQLSELSSENDSKPAIRNLILKVRRFKPNSMVVSCKTARLRGGKGFCEVKRNQNDRKHLPASAVSRQRPTRFRGGNWAALIERLEQS
jgi:hypothetical protein